MWKHYLLALFTLGTTQWDVISDIWNGAHYLATKNVTRLYESDWYPDGLPDGCVLDENNENIVNMTMEMKCLEHDQVWGWSSIGLVQAPMLVGGQFVVMAVLFPFCPFEKLKGFSAFCAVVLFVIFVPLLSLAIPYPLVVLAAQTIYILKPNQKLEISNIAEVMIILVSLEAVAEAGPQALLQLYVLLSDHERKYTLMTILSLVNSVFTIAKASITLFSSGTKVGKSREKSLSAGEPSAVVGFYSTVIRFLPVFCTSIIFRVSSSCITLVLLKSWGFIPLAVGAVTTTVLSIKLNNEVQISNFGAHGKATFDERNFFVRNIDSLQHGFGGIAVLVSSFIGTRQEEKIPMMISCVVWLITHSITLLVTAAMVANPQYHLQHWKNTARIPLLAKDNAYILYIIIGILILVGILNVFLVWFQIYSVKWSEVNRNIVKRMRWIRGEEHGKMPEVGSVEPHLRKVVDKIVECWTSCKTQTLACCKEKFCCCCIRDIEGKGSGPEGHEMLKVEEDDNVSTTQVPNFVPASNGKIPAYAFPVNVFKGETFYLARAIIPSKHDEKIPDAKIPVNVFNGKPFYLSQAILPNHDEKIPGYLVPSKEAVFVSWGLKSFAKKEYEVLVESGQRSFYWVDSTKAKSSLEALGAVGVGTMTNGETMYIGRAKVDKEWLIGKINPSHRACFIASHKEPEYIELRTFDRDIEADGARERYNPNSDYEVQEYEVLCSKPTTSPGPNIETKPKLVLVFE